MTFSIRAANQAHLSYAATTVASVCRRARRPVHARVYVRDGELPEAFVAGYLTVEFARPARPFGGGMWPDSVKPCASDRFEIVDDATDWDRCWILDTDQIVIGDPGEYYDTDFGGAWMAGRSGRSGKGVPRGTCSPFEPPRQAVRRSFAARCPTVAAGTHRLGGTETRTAVPGARSRQGARVSNPPAGRCRRRIDRLEARLP